MPDLILRKLCARRKKPAIRRAATGSATGSGGPVSRCLAADHLNGVGRGVLSAEGGSSGMVNKGWSPVSVLRKATIC